MAAQNYLEKLPLKSTFLPKGFNVHCAPLWMPYFYLFCFQNVLDKLSTFYQHLPNSFWLCQHRFRNATFQKQHKWNYVLFDWKPLLGNFSMVTFSELLPLILDNFQMENLRRENLNNVVPEGVPFPSYGLHFLENVSGASSLFLVCLSAKKELDIQFSLLLLLW